MEKGLIDVEMVFPTDTQATKITKPGEGSLHFPAASVSPQAPTILNLMGPGFQMRTDQLNPLFCQLFSQFPCIIGSVGNQPNWLHPWTKRLFPRDPDFRQGLRDQLVFTLVRRIEVGCQRHSLTVHHHHPLRSLAFAGESHSGPPFLAAAKLPSMKFSCQSNLARSSSSIKKARQTFSQVPSSSQSRRRRQQVEGLGYIFGNAAQGAPVHKIQRMPSKAARSEPHGRPPLREGLG